MGPVLMGLNRAGLESKTPWVPGFPATGGLKGGQNRNACPQAGAYSFSA